MTNQKGERVETGRGTSSNNSSRRGSAIGREGPLSPINVTRGDSSAGEFHFEILGRVCLKLETPLNVRGKRQRLESVGSEWRGLFACIRAGMFA